MSPKFTRRAFLQLSRYALPLAASLLPGGEALPALAAGLHQPDQKPNILLLVFDSLSARSMSLYGYPRRTTPNLENFAGRATVFHAHYAAGNFTSPGTASILTGVYPWTHRAFNLSAVPTEDFRDRNLFAAFERAGYHRLAYTHNHLADFLLAGFQKHIDGYIPREQWLLTDRQILARLFPNDRRAASYGEDLALVRKNESSLFLSLVNRFVGENVAPASLRERFPRGLPEAFQGSFLLESAVDQISALLRQAPQPFIAYIHLLPPHEPYRTRVEYKDCFDDGLRIESKPDHFFTQHRSAEQLDRLRRSYDEYLAYADAEFGRLIGLLEQGGLLENTVIAFTADHGQLFERGIHGHITPVLYEPVIHIPLLIYDPRRPFRQDVYAPTSAVDLLPTLLAAAGADPPDWCEGVALPPYRPAPPAGSRSVYTVEAKQNASRAPLTKATLAVIQEQTKLIAYYGYPGFDRQYELYDLAGDRDEFANLAASRRETAEEMRAGLETNLQNLNQAYMKNF